MYIEETVNKFRTISGTIQRTFKNELRKGIHIKMHKAIHVPTLLYGSKTLVPNRKRLVKILKN